MTRAGILREVDDSTSGERFDPLADDLGLSLLALFGVDRIGERPDQVDMATFGEAMASAFGQDKWDTVKADFVQWDAAAGRFVESSVKARSSVGAKVVEWLCEYPNFAAVRVRLDAIAELANDASLKYDYRPTADYIMAELTETNRRLRRTHLIGQNLGVLCKVAGPEVFGRSDGGLLPDEEYLLTDKGWGLGYTALPSANHHGASATSIGR